MIARLAERQHGVVARWQLLKLGVTREMIAIRREAKRLRQLHRGVYLVGPVLPAHAREMAAVLAYRLKAVLSHWSAAALWELFPNYSTGPVWITVRPERGATRAGIKAVRAPLGRADIRKRHGMWITSPARTVLDMAALMDREDLEQLAAQAQYRWRVTETDLREQIARNPGRRGTPALTATLRVPGGPQRTRSNGERALLRLLRMHGLTGFETNARVAGYEVDFLWRTEQVIVELDGWDGHSSRGAFERDRLKWSELQTCGFRVLTVTGRQLSGDPGGVVARISTALTDLTT